MDLNISIIFTSVIVKIITLTIDYKKVRFKVNVSPVYQMLSDVLGRITSFCNWLGST